MTTKDWLIARLREPSTHLAVAGFLATFGFTADAGMIGDICVGIAAAQGLAAIVMREKAS